MARATSKKKASSKKSSSTAVARREESADMTIVEDRPDYAGGGRGSEEVSASDLTIPRVDVIQDLSPQIKPNKPEYLEGAEVGDLFNTVTGDIYGGEITFVPCYFRKEWVVWKNRAEGGGFCGAFDTREEAEAVAEQLGTETSSKNGQPMHEAIDTAQHFGLILREDEKIEEVVLSLAKTKMRASRTMNTMARMRGGDSFASAYRIYTVEDQNSQGQEFWNIRVQALGWVSPDVYERGEHLYEAVSGGVKDVAREETAEDVEG